jgi:hypothetical protein
LNPVTVAAPAESAPAVSDTAKHMLAARGDPGDRRRASALTEEALAVGRALGMRPLL